MKRPLLLMTFILILFQALLAMPDKPKKNSIGLQTGAQSSALKDELASPLTYKGTGMFVQLAYRYAGSKNRHSICLSYSRFDLEPKTELSFGRHSLDNLQAGVYYSYHRYAASLFRDKFKVYLGGAWDTFFSLRHLYYVGSAGEIYADVFSSVDVSIQMEWPMSSKCRIACQTSLPLVVFVIRPPYAEKGPATPKITAIGRFIRLKNSLELEHALSRRFWVRLTYAYTYYQYPEPQAVGSGADLYAASLVFKF